MTILDQITCEAKTLSTQERRQALRLIKSLRTRADTKSVAPARKSRIDKRKLHPALRAIAGMWKDRKDLPKDGAAASMILRRRLMGRDIHA